MSTILIGCSNLHWYKSRIKYSRQLWNNLFYWRYCYLHLLPLSHIPIRATRKRGERAQSWRSAVRESHWNLPTPSSLFRKETTNERTMTKSNGEWNVLYCLCESTRPQERATMPCTQDTVSKLYGAQIIYFNAFYVLMLWLCAHNYECNMPYCVHRERDVYETEVRELRKKLEMLDLTHTALTRERNDLNKEVRWLRDKHIH